MHHPIFRHHIHPLLLPLHSSRRTSRLLSRKMGVCTGCVYDTQRKRTIDQYLVREFLAGGELGQYV